MSRLKSKPIYELFYTTNINKDEYLDKTNVFVVDILIKDYARAGREQG